MLYLQGVQDASFLTMTKYTVFNNKCIFTLCLK